MKKILSFFLISGAAVCSSVISQESTSQSISVLVYNVENLFDLDGKAMFSDYQQDPSKAYPYNPQRFYTKVSNHAEVIRAFDHGKGPDIVAIQEFEVDFTPDPEFNLVATLERYQDISLKTLLLEKWDETVAQFPVEFFLMKRLKELGLDDYQFHSPEFRTDWWDRGIAHRCVYLSRFSTVSENQYRIDQARDIFEVTFDVLGQRLTIFNNHWKSGASSADREPTRIQNARTLREVLDDKLSEDREADVLLVGDFNTHHNPRLRLNVEETAIDDVLGSQSREVALVEGDADLYNLWYELPAEERGSEVWRGEWGTLMQIIATPGLYDTVGLQYVDQSFGIHKIDGLNYDPETDQPIRWEPLGKGSGASDHLPVFARFRVQMGEGSLKEIELGALGREEDKEHIPIKLDYSLNWENVSTDPQSLAEASEHELSQSMGKRFLVETKISGGRIEWGDDSFTIYSFDPEIFSIIREWEEGENVKFVGEFGVYREQLQFLIHDQSWIYLEDQP